MHDLHVSRIQEHFRPSFKSKFELNSKKSNSSDAKIFSSVFISFFALKAKLQF